VYLKNAVYKPLILWYNILRMKQEHTKKEKKRGFYENVAHVAILPWFILMGVLSWIVFIGLLVILRHLVSILFGI
tara:strand:+ start:594 stop:818 length:225 start_codon:yes stop_codon:yes gene_type:complete